VELIDPGHEERVLARLAAAGITRQVDLLPERQRQVLAMRSEGVTVTDIAARLDLPCKTVESLLSRARSALRAAAKGEHRRADDGEAC
jgi:DNA-directed RNA polymerase specialized sigma24 family protein